MTQIVLDEVYYDAVSKEDLWYYVVYMVIHYQLCSNESEFNPICIGGILYPRNQSF